VIIVLATLVALGAAAAALLLRRLAQRVPLARDTLAAATRESERTPGELDGIERTVAQALAAGRTTGDELPDLVRAIAAARLLREHGVELEHEPDRARELIDDDLTWRLAQPPADRRRGGTEPLGAPELGRVIDVLERL
jgi:hypothetical protein